MKEDITITHFHINNGELDKRFKDVTINGNFSCIHLNITSLNNFPKKINGTINLIGNKLSNLENFPEVSGNIWLDDNELTSLKGLPSKTSGTLSIKDNKLTTLEHCSEEVNSDFWCCNNALTNLKYGPNIVYGNYNCSGNKIDTLEYFPMRCLSFSIEYNYIYSLYEICNHNISKNATCGDYAESKFLRNNSVVINDIYSYKFHFYKYCIENDYSIDNKMFDNIFLESDGVKSLNGIEKFDL